MFIASNRNFIHPVARAYFDKVRSGGAGLEVQDKKSINDFVIGLSSILDLSTFACLPMTSAHNIGTGSTVYALGGMNPANFVGTLVSGPTWGTTGITKSSSAQTLTIPNDYPFILTAPSFGFVIQATGPTGFGNLHCYDVGGGFSTDTYVQSFYTTDINTFTARCTRAGIFSQTNSVSIAGRSFLSNFAAISMASSSNFAQVNSSFSTPLTGLSPRNATGPSSGQTFLIPTGPYAANSALWGVYSFYWWCATELTQAQHTAIYNLYKATLGAGLNLP